MSISSSTRKAGPYSGNGSTTAFPFLFKVFQASDLVVTLTDPYGTLTTQILTTQYSVSLNSDQDNNPGGTVTMVAAPATGYTLTLTSNVPATQPMVLTNTGGFFPTVINQALDRVTILVQQLMESVSRVVSLPVSVASGVSGTFPVPSASQLLGWNSTATALQNVDPTTLTVTGALNHTYSVFSGNGSTTVFTLGTAPGVPANMVVSISGVIQTPGSDFTVSGTTLTFTTAPPNGTTILAIYGQSFAQALPPFNREYYTPTAGQTLFSLVNQYSPGTNTLAVYVNGAKQIAGVDYTETSVSSVTFAMGLSTSDVVEFVLGTGINRTALDSSTVGFVPAGTNASNRSVQAKLREWVHIADFGGVADGVTDTTGALNAAIAASVASGTTTIRFSRGVYRFATKPNDITTPVNIVGEGKNTTYLVRDYSGTVASDGLFNFRAGASTAPTASSISDCALISEVGRSGGCLISLVQPATGDGCDWSRFNNLRLTTNGTSTHDYGFYLDGSARTSPLGLRSTWIEDCIVFGGALGAAYLKSVVNFNWNNTPTYIAGGAFGKIVLTGSASVNSYNARFTAPAIYGMDLDYAQHVLIDSSEMNGAVTNTANVLNVSARYNQTSGSTQNNWSNSNWISPGGVQNSLLMERGGGGNQWTARFNSSNMRSGMYTGGTSGQTFFGGNLTWSGSGNVFNFDKTGFAWFMGDTGSGRLAIGAISGSAGSDAGVTTTSDALRLDANGNVWPGRASASNMTNGFFYIPSAAGAPSGAPTAISGYVPMYYDSTNNQFYVYNGAWKKVTLA